MMKYIGHFVAIITFSFNCYAQTDVNYSKYWYYRYKLLTQFVKIGKGTTTCGVLDEPDDGLSIPATGINYDDDNVGWGDSPERLGLYISTLATEYALLSNSGYPTQKVKEELYYAFIAFERLDDRAERFFYQGMD